MTLSMRQIKQRIKRKTDPAIIDLLSVMRKHHAWHSVAQRLSAARREYASVNLFNVENNTKEGERIVISGRVLGSGHITKKVSVCAVGFSQQAVKKLKEVKGESVLLIDEVRRNPEARGIKFYNG